MKVTKTPTQPTFQPIELKITIESAEEMEHVKALWVKAEDICETLNDYECLDYDEAKMLESLLCYIGECL